jgi:hypothetical protein
MSGNEPLLVASQCGSFVSTHDLSVWSSSSLGRWHPISSVLLVLTRHSSPILNEWWTRVINLSMVFLLCYDLTTILRSRALHWVLSSAIQYAWCSYMLSRLYRKVKTFRSDLLTLLYFCEASSLMITNVFCWRIECVLQYHNCIHFAAWSSVQPKLSWGRPWLEELLWHASGPANW